MRIDFIAIPKCASIATSDFCKDNGIQVHWHTHFLSWWIRETASRMQADRLFAILRDPVDRVLSAWRFLKAGGINSTDAVDWRRYCAGFESFEDFIAYGLEPASREQIHFLPQWFWVLPPGQKVARDKLEFIRFECLQEDLGAFAGRHGLRFRPLARRNASPQDGPQVTDEQAAIIAAIYRKDYELILEAFGHGG
jgi:hypothetical protein